MHGEYHYLLSVHTVKICCLFCACKAITVNIAFVCVRCENGGICRQMFPFRAITETCFVSNIMTAIICFTLKPLNVANAAYLRLKAAWNISKCDPCLTCWHILICMPNTMSTPCLWVSELTTQSTTISTRSSSCVVAYFFKSMCVIYCTGIC